MRQLLSVDGMRVICGHGAGELVAVDSADLILGPGEVIGLIGESGSGKTTLVRSLIGLLGRSCRPVAGTIAFEGRTIFGNGVNDLDRIRGSKVGMVFQNPTSSLNPLLKVETQLAEVLRVHGFPDSEVDSRIDQLLVDLGFEDPKRVRRSYPHQLSGGMCQRVAIALAIAPEPALLIADECTSALDVTTQAEVIALLRRITRDRHLSLLFVTHDILLATELCHRLVVMYGGQVVEEGPVTDIVQSAQHPYTRALLDAAPRWRPRTEMRGIPGTPPVTPVDFVGCRFASRCPSATSSCIQKDVEWKTVSDRSGHRCLFPLPTDSRLQ